MIPATEVCLTVDVEFSIGGALTYPNRFVPIGVENVLCAIEGREHGLGAILEILAAHRLTADFFCEVLNTLYFGDQPMQAIAERIRLAGHGVYPHLHPCWLHFRDPAWRLGSAGRPVNDSLCGRSLTEVEAILREGVAIFRRWGVGEPVALRTGGLQVDLPIYQAMRNVGIPAASNIGVGIYRPKEPELQLYGGRQRIAGVLELPVLSYLSQSPHGGKVARSLTLAGSSWPEIRWLLWRARQEKISPVVILTHPFEMVKRDRRHFAIRPNPLVQGRLAALCRFLANHRQEFTTIRIADGWRNWITQPVASTPPWTTPWPWQLHRLVQNYCNR